MKMSTLTCATILMFGPFVVTHAASEHHMPSQQRMHQALTQFKDRLNLNESQSVLWNQYTKALQAMRQHQKEGRKAMKQSRSKSESPVDRLDNRITHLEKSLSLLKNTRTALKDFYNTLNSEQQDQFKKGIQRMMQHKKMR